MKDAVAFKGTVEGLNLVSMHFLEELHYSEYLLKILACCDIVQYRNNPGLMETKYAFKHQNDVVYNKYYFSVLGPLGNKVKPQKTSAFSRQCITRIANLIYTCFI